MKWKIVLLLHMVPRQFPAMESWNDRIYFPKESRLLQNGAWRANYIQLWWNYYRNLPGHRLFHCRGIFSLQTPYSTHQTQNERKKIKTRHRSPGGERRRKRKRFGDPLWKDEKEPSSDRPDIGSGSNWKTAPGKLTGWSAYGLPRLVDTTLNWTERNWSRLSSPPKDYSRSSPPWTHKLWVVRG